MGNILSILQVREQVTLPTSKCQPGASLPPSFINLMSTVCVPVTVVAHGGGQKV